MKTLYSNFPLLGALIVCTTIFNSVADIHSGFLTVIDKPAQCANPARIMDNPDIATEITPADQCHITFENDSIYSQTESIIAWDQLWKFLEDKKINSFTKTNWRYDVQLLDSLLRESRAKVNPAGFVKSIPSGTKCFAVLTNSNHFALFVSVSSFYKEDTPCKYYVAYNDKELDVVLYKNEFQNVPDSLDITIQYATQNKNVVLKDKHQILRIVNFFVCAENPHFYSPVNSIGSHRCDFSKISYTGMTILNPRFPSKSDLVGKVTISNGQVIHRYASEYSSHRQPVTIPNPNGIVESSIAEILCNATCAHHINPTCELFPKCMYQFNDGKYWNYVGCPAQSCNPSLSAYRCTTRVVKDIDAIVAPWAPMDSRFLLGAALGKEGFSTSMVVITRNEVVEKTIWQSLSIDIAKTGKINTVVADNTERFIIGTEKAGALIYSKWWLDIDKALEPLCAGLPKRNGSDEYMEIVNLTKSESVIYAHLANGDQYIIDYDKNEWQKSTKKHEIKDIVWDSYTCGMEHEIIIKVKNVSPGLVTITESNNVFLLPASRIADSIKTSSTGESIARYSQPNKSTYGRQSVQSAGYVYDIKGRLIRGDKIDRYKKNGIYLIVSDQDKRFQSVKRVISIK